MSELSERSKQLRRDAYLLSKANGGYHYGGTFSCVEIMIALFDFLMCGADRFILSKGHACWVYYVLLIEEGMNPRLEGHPSRDPANGIHVTTGSLGHGLPVGVGMALARKINNKDGHVYVLMGDGECQEGTTWESMLIAAKYKLDNLTVIVDWNNIQGSGRTAEILPYEIMGLEKMAQGLLWETNHAVNGHDVAQLCVTLNEIQERPRLIIANTIKGKGVSIMEDKPEWHARWPNKAEEDIILRELK